MPNHVHLILAPSDADGLRRALAHRVYAGAIHARERRTGHFWQGRFAEVAMDEGHLAAAVRYVLLNPVRAGVVDRAEAWPWSSPRAYLAGEPDGVTDLAPLASRFPDPADLLDMSEEETSAMQDRLRRAGSSGRPVGSADFLRRLEETLGRPVAPRKRGPKPGASEQSE